MSKERGTKQEILLSRQNVPSCLLIFKPKQPCCFQKQTPTLPKYLTNLKHFQKINTLYAFLQKQEPLQRHLFKITFKNTFHKHLFELFSKPTLCMCSYRNENHYKDTFSKSLSKPHSTSTSLKYFQNQHFIHVLIETRTITKTFSSKYFQTHTTSTFSNKSK